MDGVPNGTDCEFITFDKIDSIRSELDSMAKGSFTFEMGKYHVSNESNGVLALIPQ